MIEPELPSVSRSWILNQHDWRSKTLVERPAQVYLEGFECVTLQVSYHLDNLNLVSNERGAHTISRTSYKSFE